jgi:hypothetical protein
MLKNINPTFLKNIDPTFPKNVKNIDPTLKCWSRKC